MDAQAIEFTKAMAGIRRDARPSTGASSEIAVLAVDPADQHRGAGAR
jgi:hypothetical protein